MRTSISQKIVLAARPRFYPHTMRLSSLSGTSRQTVVVVLGTYRASLSPLMHIYILDYLVGVAQRDDPSNPPTGRRRYTEPLQFNYHRRNTKYGMSVDRPCLDCRSRPVPHTRPHTNPRPHLTFACLCSGSARPALTVSWSVPWNVPVVAVVLVLVTAMMKSRPRTSRPRDLGKISRTDNIS